MYCLLNVFEKGLEGLEVFGNQTLEVHSNLYLVCDSGCTCMKYLGTLTPEKALVFTSREGGLHLTKGVMSGMKDV